MKIRETRKPKNIEKTNDTLNEDNRKIGNYDSLSSYLSDVLGPEFYEQDNTPMDIKITKEHAKREFKPITRSSKYGNKEKNQYDQELDDIINSLKNLNVKKESKEEKENIQVTEPKEEVITEPVLDSEEIEELDDLIQNKYIDLITKLNNIYDHKDVIDEAHQIKEQLEDIMNKDSFTPETLSSANEQIDELFKKYEDLNNRAEELRANDNKEIEEQSVRLNELNNYQSSLTNKYGKYWFSKMSDEEKNNYIDLYSNGYKVPKIEVVKMIDDSIDKAYKEIIAEKEQERLREEENKQKEQNESITSLNVYQNDLSNKYGRYWFGKVSEEEKNKYIDLYSKAHNVSKEEVEKMIDDSISKAYEEIKNQEQVNDVFIGKYNSEINENQKNAVMKLKEIHSRMEEADSESIEYFSFLYNTLSEIAKRKPTDQASEEQKLAELYNIMEGIDSLYQRVNTSKSK